jgi:lipid-A-disaccharide synthase
MTKFYISTGEQSGEQHAASLVREIKKLSPETEITAMGGELLKSAGAEIFVNYGELAVTGFTEVIRHLPKIRKTLNRCTQHIVDTSPDAVILVDYPGFNMQLAKRIKKADPGIRIFYYICPKFWAWNYRRTKKLYEYTDRIYCILPFEVALLSREIILSEYVGNPLLDQINLEEDGSRLQSELRLENKDIIALFPGSRKTEISLTLKNIIEAAEAIKDKVENTEYVIGIAPGYTKEDIEKISGVSLQGKNVCYNRSHELMAACKCAIVNSGTTTLELALFGKPMVGVYYSSRITMAIAKRLLRIKHFTLPNIMLDDFAPKGKKKREALLELLQDDASKENISNEIIHLLSDKYYYRNKKSLLNEVKELLGSQSCSKTAAESILLRTEHPYNLDEKVKLFDMNELGILHMQSQQEYQQVYFLKFAGVFGMIKYFFCVIRGKSLEEIAMRMKIKCEECLKYSSNDLKKNLARIYLEYWTTILSDEELFLRASQKLLYELNKAKKEIKSK